MTFAIFWNSNFELDWSKVEKRSSNIIARRLMPGRPWSSILSALDWNFPIEYAGSFCREDCQLTRIVDENRLWHTISMATSSDAVMKAAAHLAKVNSIRNKIGLPSLEKIGVAAPLSFPSSVISLICFHDSTIYLPLLFDPSNKVSNKQRNTRALMQNNSTRRGNHRKLFKDSRFSRRFIRQSWGH